MPIFVNTNKINAIGEFEPIPQTTNTLANEIYFPGASYLVTFENEATTLSDPLFSNINYTEHANIKTLDLDAANSSTYNCILHTNKFNTTTIPSTLWIWQPSNDRVSIFNFLNFTRSPNLTHINGETTIFHPGIKDIVNSSYSPFRSLISINFPNNWGNVTNINTLFNNCRILQSVYLPNSWGNITNVNALCDNCYNLNFVSLPNSWGNVTNISRAFGNCYNLQSISLPNSWGNVTTIDTLFINCYNLQSVSFPNTWDNITRISGSCANCYNFNTPFSFEWGNRQDASINVGAFSALNSFNSAFSFTLSNLHNTSTNISYSFNQWNNFNTPFSLTLSNLYNVSINTVSSFIFWNNFNSPLTLIFQDIYNCNTILFNNSFIWWNNFNASYSVTLKNIYNSSTISLVANNRRLNASDTTIYIENVFTTSNVYNGFLPASTSSLNLHVINSNSTIQCAVTSSIFMMDSTFHTTFNLSIISNNIFSESPGNIFFDNISSTNAGSFTFIHNIKPLNSFHFCNFSNINYLNIGAISSDASIQTINISNIFVNNINLIRLNTQCNPSLIDIDISANFINTVSLFSGCTLFNTPTSAVNITLNCANVNVTSFFYNCNNWIANSMQIFKYPNGEYVNTHEPSPSNWITTNCFRNCNKLLDYAVIHSSWK
jgi:hypothetical protein